MSQTYRAMQIVGDFGLEHLEVKERPVPEPGPRQILVRMTAASLNYRDLLMVTGRYNPRQPLPLVPGSDGAGEIVAIGDEVTRFAVGDRVTPTFFRHWLAGAPSRDLLRQALGGPIDGTMSEFQCAPEESFVATPVHLDDHEAATLTCAGVTAWSALVTQGNLCPGQSVLIQGTGGVSSFAMQFALMHGARVILTSSSDEKLEQMSNTFGISDTINYRNVPEWGKRVRELTDGEGVDHVIEVGGAGTLQQSIRAAKVGGTISLIGVLAGGSDAVNLIPVLMQNIRVQGVIVGPREAHEAMNRAVELHGMKPVLDEVFPLEDGRKAFERMAAGRHVGKIVVDLGR